MRAADPGEQSIGEREALKRLAAEMAVGLVESGMVIGLGVGSTAIYAVRKIAALLAMGELQSIIGIPCALSVEAEARRLGIPIGSLDAYARVDLTIDGADEVDPQLNLIKGGGAALLREKMVAQASARVAIVVDEAKLSPHLGSNFALPVEVVPFGWGASARFISGLGATVSLRRTADGEPLRTDQGNYLLACSFGPISDPAAIATALEHRAGIVEHGLFLGLASDLFVASQSGVKQLRRAS